MGYQRHAAKETYMLPSKNPSDEAKVSQETGCDTIIGFGRAFLLPSNIFTACGGSIFQLSGRSPDYHPSSGSDVKAGAPQWILGHRAILTHDRNGRGVFPRKCSILLQIPHHKGRIRCYYLLFVSWLTGWLF